MSSLTEEEYHKLEEQQEIKEVFGILETLGDEDDEEDEKSRHGGRKRRSESVVSISTQGADEDDYQGTPEPKPKGKARGKAKCVHQEGIRILHSSDYCFVRRRRVSKSDDETSDEVPSAPTRELPKRSACVIDFLFTDHANIICSRKAPIVVQPLPDSDEEEDVPTEVGQSESENEDSTPPPRPRKTQTT